jgi:hypothetical protein
MRRGCEFSRLLNRGIRWRYVFSFMLNMELDRPKNHSGGGGGGVRVNPSTVTKPRFRSSLKCKLVTRWIKLPRPPTHIHTITSALFIMFII